jgi:hypothetical protein
MNSSHLSKLSESHTKITTHETSMQRTSELNMPIRKKISCYESALEQMQ